MEKSRSNLHTITLTALFAALICGLTLFYIPLPAERGYIHFGDSLIYMAACFLPAPYAMLAGSIGGGLADFISGYPIWIIPTIIIKALITLPISSKTETILTKRNMLMLLLSGAISMTGYFLAEFLLFGNIGVSLYNILPSLIQSGGSAMIFIMVGKILDKMNFKKTVWRI